MKKIVLGLILFLFLGNFSFAGENKCIAKKGDNKTFYNCIKKYTLENKNSSGILDGMFGKIDIKIIIENDIRYIQDMKGIGLYICTINKNEKQKFLKTLEKWSTGKFGSSDMNYAKCEIKKEIIGEKNIEAKNKNIEAKINLSDYNIQDFSNSFKLLEKNNKGYLYYFDDNLKENILEIKGSSGKGLKLVDSFKVIKDNKNIYKLNSFSSTLIEYKKDKKGYINYGTNYEILNEKLEKPIMTLFLMDDSTYKIIKSDVKIDLNTFERIKTKENKWVHYFKDKNYVYYKSSFKGFKRMEKVDKNSFISKDNLFAQGEDKNYKYKEDKISFRKNIAKLSKKQLLKNYLIAKSKLSKNKQLNKYISKLNNIIPKINLEKLKNINLKLEKKYLENKKYSKIKVLIEYLKAKIDLEIYKRENK